MRGFGGEVVIDDVAALDSTRWPTQSGAHERLVGSLILNGTRRPGSIKQSMVLDMMLLSNCDKCTCFY